MSAAVSRCIGRQFATVRGMQVATHSGPFHADDVFAFAMLRVFLGRQLALVRTRDLAVIAAADIAIDVGGVFDPERLRFDHHQRAYTGSLSSAGMVLNWLEATGKVPRELAAKLRIEWVDYIDAVDTGRREPEDGVPGLGAVLGAIGEQADSMADFNVRYLEAVAVCEAVIAGVQAGLRKTEQAREAVHAAMDRALADGSRILSFDRHCKWKRAYFERGGAEHPTDYILFPDDTSWRLVAIPPERDSFAQKRPLPASWAGLVDAELSAAVGVQGAKFCHKNRFIAVFATQGAIQAAIDKWGLATGVSHD